MAMDEHDMQQESILWPWIDDPGPDASDEDNYDPDEWIHQCRMGLRRILWPLRRRVIPTRGLW